MVLGYVCDDALSRLIDWIIDVLAPKWCGSFDPTPFGEEDAHVRVLIGLLSCFYPCQFPRVLLTTLCISVSL